MADILPDPSQFHLEGFEVEDVLDSRRNMVVRACGTADSTHTVVLKLLRPEFEPILPGRNRAGSRKLIRAVKRSDGWAPVLEAGTSTDGLEYIMQPHYPDGSLHDRLGRCGHWRPSLSLVGDAAAILGQLGAQKLALGCLRPSYILVDNDTVVVSVFGMSTRRFDDGTIQYLAPEQQAGFEATPASDVTPSAISWPSCLPAGNTGPTSRPTISSHRFPFRFRPS